MYIHTHTHTHTTDARVRCASQGNWNEEMVFEKRTVFEDLEKNDGQKQGAGSRSAEPGKTKNADHWTWCGRMVFGTLGCLQKNRTWITEQSIG